MAEIPPALTYDALAHSLTSASVSDPVVTLIFSSVNRLLLNLSLSSTVPPESAAPGLFSTKKFLFVGSKLGKNFAYEPKVASGRPLSFMLVSEFF